MTSEIIFKGTPNYKGTAFIVLLSVGAGLIAFGRFHSYYQSLTTDHPEDIFSKDFLYGVFSLIIIPFLLKGVFKRSRKLSVDEGNIYLDDKSIPFKDIAHMNVNALVGVTKANSGTEAVQIKLRTGEEVVIEINDYGNGKEFRTICDKINVSIASRVYRINNDEAEATVSTEESPGTPIDEQHFEKFLGGPLESFRWLMVVFFVLCGVCISLTSNGTTASSFMYFLVLVFLGFIAGYPLNYFLVSPDYIVVKHHLYWWRKEVIPIKNVKRVSVVNDYKAGQMLELLMSDNNLRTFYTGQTFKVSLDPLVQFIDGQLGK